MKEYKVLKFAHKNGPRKGSLDVEYVENMLNEHARQGWRVVTSIALSQILPS